MKTCRAEQKRISKACFAHRIMSKRVKRDWNSLNSVHQRIFGDNDSGKTHYGGHGDWMNSSSEGNANSSNHGQYRNRRGRGQTNSCNISRKGEKNGRDAPRHRNSSSSRGGYDNRRALLKKSMFVDPWASLTIALQHQGHNINKTPQYTPIFMVLPEAQASEQPLTQPPPPPPPPPQLGGAPTAAAICP